MIRRLLDLWPMFDAGPRWLWRVWEWVARREW